jgi:hypothetical protein
MRMLPFALVLELHALFAAAAAAQTRPARVDMELVADRQTQTSAQQQWYELLTELKVDALRLRVNSADAPEKPAITPAGRPEAPAYKVVGILTRSGELILPGGRFRATDRAQIAAWLTKLREEGPERARGGPRLPFGLTKEQFAGAQQDLSRAIGFSTKGLAADDFVDRVADLVRHSVTGEANVEALLTAGKPVDAELKGLSAGTALAYVLAQKGLTFAPRLDSSRQLAYMIAPIRKSQEQWPIGWPSKQPKRDLLPALFDTVEVELNDVELARVLSAVAEHVPAPILVDGPALAAEKKDLEKIKVSLPAKRSIYESVLDKVLVPKMLTHEMRVDEAEHPFLWITSARRASDTQAKPKKN